MTKNSDVIKLLQDINIRLTKIEDRQEDIISKQAEMYQQFSSGNRTARSRTLLPEGLFPADTVFSNVEEHPKNNSKSRSQQFSWKMMENLATTTFNKMNGLPWDHPLGAYESHIVSLISTYVLPITKDTIEHLKQKYPLERQKSWGQVSKSVQLEAFELIEEKAKSFVPLSVCKRHWGARALFHNHWKTVRWPSIDSDNLPDESTAPTTSGADADLASDADVDAELASGSNADAVLASGSGSGAGSSLASAPASGGSRKRPLPDENRSTKQTKQRELRMQRKTKLQPIASKPNV